jgi:hypothetical protein
MNLFTEMFRSKASSADPLSPGHDEGSTFDSLSGERTKGRGAEVSIFHY